VGEISILADTVGLRTLLLLGPISENPDYHHFADHRTILGVPNFCNVLSNALLLLVAMWDCSAFSNRAAFTEPWERHAYLILLGGLSLVAFGSGYLENRNYKVTALLRYVVE
jgi:hypothetical protein